MNEDFDKPINGRDTWCPQPWLGLSARTVGDLRYCCNANNAKGKGILLNDHGEPINLSIDSLQEGVNSPLLKEVRKFMVEGKEHPSCARCYKEETSGLVSRRKLEKTLWDKTSFQQLQDGTEEDGEIDPEKFPLKYLDLRFGNRCNLSCRMCSPTESDQWYDLQPRVWGVENFKEGDFKVSLKLNNEGKYDVKNSPYDWYKNPKFWTDFEEILPSLEHLYFAGGEPLLIEPHLKILEECIIQGFSKNMLLEYNSNIIPLQPRMLEIWKHFKEVQIGASIDGVGRVNEYIRHPSRWDVVEDKIALLDGSDAVTKLRWTTTVQVYNFLHLPDMMMWILDQDYKKVNLSLRGREILTPHPLHDPKFLSIKIFPPSSKKKIRNLMHRKKIEGIEKIMEMDFTVQEIVGMDLSKENINQRYAERFAEIINKYCDLMDKADYSQYLEKFWHYTSKLDEIHHTSFTELFPETAELLKV